MKWHKILTQVRETTPLVQCITNFVTVNDCANILLAAGASPTMAMDIREVEEVVTQAQALVCNLGAIERTEAMILAGKQANKLGIPVILDPVAAGGTTLRQNLSTKLLGEVQFTAIRGNASEIKALVHQGSGGIGVDVSLQDAVTRENFKDAVALVRQLAQKTGAVVAMSGVIDIVSDGTQTALLHNGCATMARITGSGCMLTALIGAFCGVGQEQPFDAVCTAVTTMGICGELAEIRRLTNRTGTASFRMDLIDAVFLLTEQEFKEKMRYEIYRT